MPVEPPQNGEYMLAAYVVTAVVLLGYWVRLWSRARSMAAQSEKRKR